MDSQSPFAVLTLIGAPALLTNTSSVLALSTTTRMLRTRERMETLFARSATPDLSPAEAARLVETVNRVEHQAGLLLRSLHAIYIALGSFSAATLVTLLGAALAPYQAALWFRGLTWLALGLGLAGVSGLIFGCAKLFQATQLSLVMTREEAAIIRQRQSAAVATLARSAPPPAHKP
jgi:hypothetical protein